MVKVIFGGKKKKKKRGLLYLLYRSEIELRNVKKKKKIHHQL